MYSIESTQLQERNVEYWVIGSPSAFSYAVGSPSICDRDILNSDGGIAALRYNIFYYDSTIYI